MLAFSRDPRLPTTRTNWTCRSVAQAYTSTNRGKTYTRDPFGLRVDAQDPLISNLDSQMKACRPQRTSESRRGLRLASRRAPYACLIEERRAGWAEPTPLFIWLNPRSVGRPTMLGEDCRTLSCSCLQIRGHVTQIVETGLLLVQA